MTESPARFDQVYDSMLQDARRRYGGVRVEERAFLSSLKAAARALCEVAAASAEPLGDGPDR